VNARGELVGVTSGGNAKDSFAVDVSEVRDFLAWVLVIDRRPATDGRPLTGAWTTTWTTAAGKKELASINLRADGTVFWEDSVGTAEGSFNFDGGRLNLVLPGILFETIADLNWMGTDCFYFTRNGIEYTLTRR
jgi:hypothetical protein